MSISHLILLVFMESLYYPCCPRVVLVRHTGYNRFRLIDALVVIRIAVASWIVFDTGRVPLIIVVLVLVINSTIVVLIVIQTVLLVVHLLLVVLDIVAGGQIRESRRN